jgi:hypothetical protein
MAVRDDFAPGEVLAAADLNDTFASKLDLAGGKILQIVRATDSTDRSTTSGTIVDVTGMSVTITPQKSDSAILLIATGLLRTLHATDVDAYGEVRITDSSNNAISGAERGIIGISHTARSGGTLFHYQSGVVAFGYATPATTSAVTYKVRFMVLGDSQSISFLGVQQTSQLFAIEVSA